MSLKRKILLSVVVLGLLVTAGFLWLSDKYVVPVLMYHNVADSTSYKTDTVSPRNLEWQIAFLKNKGYNIITLDELVDGIKQGKKFPRNSVALTFDDGMRNNYTAAFPILRKYEIPAYFFISPGTVGREDSMSWSDIVSMHNAGMKFGSHGMVQAYLPDVSQKEQLYEIQESKRILETKLNERTRFYAYPIGGFTDEIKTLLQQAGYEAGFTTNRGSDRFNKDLFELNRIRVGDKDISELIFRSKLSGYYNLFRKLKNAS